MSALQSQALAPVTSSDTWRRVSVLSDSVPPTLVGHAPCHEEKRPAGDALQPSNIHTPVTGPKTHIVLEALAELFGTAFFVGFGTGANCQYVVADNGQFNSYSTVPVGWGVGLAIGNAFASRFSGGHLNPAVTTMLVIVGQVPAWKLPIYYVAQILGGLLGAAITYGVYYHPIFLFDPGHTIERTAGLFGTYPTMDTPAFSCWLAEFFPTCALVFAVLYVVTLTPRPAFPVVPLMLFITILGIGCTFGSTTSFSMNPARDLGPRLLTYMAGYGRGVWDYKNQYWLWGGQLGAISSAVFVGLSFHAFRFIETRFLEGRRKTSEGVVA